MKKVLLLIMLISTIMFEDKTMAQNCCCGCDAQEWVKNGKWRNGFKANADISVNAAEFKAQYHKNKELWDKMFAYLATTDLNALEIGNHDIVPGRLWITVSEYEPNPADKQKVESHKKFTDLQMTLRGNEKMGLARNPEVLMPYNEKRDVAFWTSNEISYYPTNPDTFFLFFPTDLHQPSVKGDGAAQKSRKIVCKIEYLP